MSRLSRASSWISAASLAALAVACLAIASIARATDPDPTEEEAPLAGETAPPPPADGREGARRDAGVDLFPRDVLGGAAGWQLAPEPAPDDERGEIDLERYIHQRIEDDRVGAGIVDAWYYTLRHAMRRDFQPDIHAFLRDRQAGMDLVERGLDELGRHAARPQQPMDPRGMSPQSLFARSREDEMIQDGFDQRSPLYAPITWHRAEVRITHSRTGEVAAVHVTRSSGSRVLDEAMVDAVRSGALAVPRPPEAVIAGRGSFVSEWAFELGDVASRAGGASVMDAPTGEGDPQAGLLGRGIMRTSVSLLRVIDAEHPTFEERRARRRGRSRAPR
jgi:TonB family protein